uniref:Leucine-rich repeat protein n=1 Tax=Paramoeba aestuarina TaxID=180227 RepID=A0A7S4JIT1_9EUKA|mmetsp:Transcript_10801/g.16283  ORF Transcript_10801/g.16283 Transcript_10801/m.16283 type:complete len:255 (+) Transcript_10801:27-791(+)
MIGISLALGCDPQDTPVDRRSVSQQTLMEMFLEGIENKERICAKGDETEDLSEWKGVLLNEEQEVVEIDWEYFGLEARKLTKKFPTGRNHFTKKPSSRKTHKEIPFFSFSPFFLKDGSEKSFDLQWLPDTLRQLLISNNEIKATLDLKKLPTDLIYIDVRRNKFSGEVCLSILPRNLEIMSLSYNRLNGTIDLTSLPSRIRQLFLESNDFIGNIDFSHLPKSLNFLDISNTRLSGKLTTRIRCFRAEKTRVQIV